MKSRKHGQGASQSKKDTGHYEVSFHLEGALINTAEPEDYVQEMAGDITHHVYVEGPADEQKDELVGRVRAWIVQVARAQEDGVSLAEVFDSINSNLDAYYSPLIDPKTEDLRQSLCDEYDVMHSDIFIIDEITILESHRHKKLGLAAMLRTIETFSGGAGLVAIKPFPLQFSSARLVESDWDRKMNFASFCTSENEALKKLQRYWGTLGFKEIPGSDIFVLPLAIRHPQLKSLDLDTL